MLSLILYKCLHFFKIFPVFEQIYKQNLHNLKVHLVRLLLLCYSTQGGTGGVSFANKNVSGLQKYLRFQNEYNKVEIELRVVQFWTEIKLVITNRTPASRSCDFVITRLISVQIALHPVQLPLYIHYLPFINYFDLLSLFRDRSLIIRQGGLEEKEQKRCKFSMTHPIKVLIFS